MGKRIEKRENGFNWMFSRQKQRFEKEKTKQGDFGQVLGFLLRNCVKNEGFSANFVEDHNKNNHFAS